MFPDCFFRQEEYNFALQDYHQALEMDIADETVKSRISVIHNEFGVAAYQEKLYLVSFKMKRSSSAHHQPLTFDITYMSYIMLVSGLLVFIYLNSLPNNKILDLFKLKS